MEELFIEVIRSVSVVGVLGVWIMAERNSHRADLVYYRDQLNGRMETIQKDITVIAASLTK